MHVVGGLGFQVGSHQGFNVSRGQLDVKVVGGQGSAEISVQGGQFFRFDTVDVKNVHDGGKEQLQFHFCQAIAKTHALAGAERQKVLGLEDLAGFRLDKPLRSKFLWLWPLNRIHVDSVQVGNNVTVGWD